MGFGSRVAQCVQQCTNDDSGLSFIPESEQDAAGGFCSKCAGLF